MTHEEKIEWEYRYWERIGIMCESGEPTEKQKEVARDEANQWFERLQDSPEQP